jgi:oxygen-independent coproporphyrinogen-3 oxidase
LAGIYLHIPFCRKACTYCDFHFSTNLKRKSEMVDGIRKEMVARKDFFSPKTIIDTVYFGGGTPSLLDEQELGGLLDKMRTLFEIAPNAEITLEANPDDLDKAKLQALSTIGINRLSIGLQSFSDSDLKLLNRSHTAGQSGDAVKRAQDLGFENITIDLIYGIPNSGMAQWTKNVQTAIELQVPHISAYSLTVEERTVLHHQVQKQAVSLLTDSDHIDQYLLLGELLDAAGIEQYELSNFAKPGFRSRHNSAYWKGLPYLGLGPSAHSYKEPERSWNVANNAAYLKKIFAAESTIENTEFLSPLDQLNEYLMTQLRIVEGLDIEWMLRNWNFDILEMETEAIQEAIENGWMRKSESHLSLTRSGFMVSDRIIRDLFQVAD